MTMRTIYSCDYCGADTTSPIRVTACPSYLATMYQATGAREFCSWEHASRWVADRGADFSGEAKEAQA